MLIDETGGAGNEMIGWLNRSFKSARCSSWLLSNGNAGKADGRACCADTEEDAENATDDDATGVNGLVAEFENGERPDWSCEDSGKR
jgi:hypothetical protein